MKKIMLFSILFISLSFGLSGCLSNQMDNTLSSLEIPLTEGVVSQLEPTFSPSEFEYTLNVPNDISLVEVIPKATEEDAIIKVNGLDINEPKAEGDSSREGAVSINLQEGNNNVEISVKDTMDATGNIYSIDIIREDLSEVREKFLNLSYTSNTTNITMPYRLYVPEGYDPEANVEYPIVLFLHGGGERGNDNEIQLSANIGATVWATEEVQNKEEMFVLAPQARNEGDDSGFGITRVNGEVNLTNVYNLSDDAITAKEILDKVINEYNIDENRIYGTGVSQGGFGIWNLALEYPDLFAAIVPVAGGGNINHKNIEEIVDLPIWVFHAKADPIIPAIEDEQMVEKLQSLGSSVKFTEYDSDAYFFPMAHFSWVPAYHDEEMIDWMISQSKE